MKKLVVVTGGAGFIGSSLVAALNQLGETNILIVDDITPAKEDNVRDCQYSDCVHKSVFLKRIVSRPKAFGHVQWICHQGACASTTETNLNYLYDNNVKYSADLIRVAAREHIALIYASSASVYGATCNRNTEDEGCEQPLSAYAISKDMVDLYARAVLKHCQSQIVGLRYFNVYGARETHKGPMRSAVSTFLSQAHTEGTIRVFRGDSSVADGEHRRDFVCVQDVVEVVLFCAYKAPHVSGVFNVGTGRATSFNELARLIVDILGFGNIEYIDMPHNVRANYQGFTRANIGKLRKAGFTQEFRSVFDGISRLVSELKLRRHTKGTAHMASHVVLRQGEPGDSRA